MILKEQIIEMEKIWSKNFEYYYASGPIGFFDIETTGLSPSSSFLILGGILGWNGDAFVLKQFFAEDEFDEAEVLKAYFQELSKYNVLVSYNGINFDQQFINKRFERKLIPSYLGLYDAASSINQHSFFHLDLFNIVRSCTNFHKFLPNLKQKTVEDFLGLKNYRTDEISGKESIGLYYDYLSGKDENILNKILLHNFDDCIQLAKLTKMFLKSDINRAAFNKGFVITKGSYNIFVTHTSFKGNSFVVTGTYKGMQFPYMRYEDNYRFDCIPHNNTFKLVCDIEHLRDGHKVADLSRLPLNEDEFKTMANYKMGYLLLAKNDTINYRECNHFIRSIILSFIAEGWC